MPMILKPIWHPANGGQGRGYAIQGKAARFVTRIVGSYSAIVGLPVFETVAMLSGVGFTVTEDGEDNGS